MVIMMDTSTKKNALAAAISRRMNMLSMRVNIHQENGACGRHKKKGTSIIQRINELINQSKKALRFYVVLAERHSSKAHTHSPALR